MWKFQYFISLLLFIGAYGRFEHKYKNSLVPDGFVLWRRNNANHMAFALTNNQICGIRVGPDLNGIEEGTWLSYIVYSVNSLYIDHLGMYNNLYKINANTPYINPVACFWNDGGPTVVVKSYQGTQVFVRGNGSQEEYKFPITDIFMGYDVYTNKLYLTTNDYLYSFTPEKFMDMVKKGIMTGANLAYLSPLTQLRTYDWSDLLAANGHLFYISHHSVYEVVNYSSIILMPIQTEKFPYLLFLKDEINTKLTTTTTTTAPVTPSQNVATSTVVYPRQADEPLTDSWTDEKKKEEIIDRRKQEEIDEIKKLLMDLLKNTHALHDNVATCFNESSTSTESSMSGIAQNLFILCFVIVLIAFACYGGFMLYKQYCIRNFRAPSMAGV